MSEKYIEIEKKLYIEQELLNLECKENCSRSIESVFKRGKNSKNLIYYITLGQIYYLLDKYEMAEREIKNGTIWQQEQTEHYIFNFIPFSYASEDIDLIKRTQEQGLKKISKFLGIELSKKIVYFLYESPIHKGIITGDYELAHTIGEKNEVHSVYGFIKIIGEHEDVHILMESKFGRSCKLFEEGIAVYLSWDRRAHFIYKKICKSGKKYPLMDLIENKKFIKSNTFITYPQSGSFIGFLIENYGIDKFKRIYSQNKSLESFVKEVYGKSLLALEKEWEEYLKTISIFNKRIKKYNFVLIFS